MADSRKTHPKTRKPSAKRRVATSNGDAADKRRARRERRRDQSREEILDGAQRVLLKRGVAGTTLEAVAKEVGMSKTALYYYFPSKDALFFELVFAVLERHAQAVHDAVEKSKTGGGALRAIVRESVDVFAPRIEDFRLAFLYGQAAGHGGVHFDEEQFARIRPLNDLWFEGTAQKLRQEAKTKPNRAGVEPRLMAFLAYLAALGLLTMKGMVESLDDPLIYSDDQLVEAFARVFDAAARP